MPHEDRVLKDPQDLRVFESLSQAEDANREYYAALSPEERLELVLELAQRHREAEGESAERLARVYRVTQLERG